MFRIFIYIFFLFFLLNYHSKTQQKYFFVFDDKILPIWIINIKGFEYFSFDVPNFEKNRAFTFKYKFEKNTFSFLPGSQFFILEDKFGNQHHFQMLRPGIIYKNRFYIPLRSFLDCLTNSNLFQTSFSSKSFAFVFREEKKEFNPPKPLKETRVLEPKAEVTQKEPERQSTKETDRWHEQKVIPRLVLTNNERFLLLNKDKSKKTERETSVVIEKQNSQNKDTAGKIPPKYYILPPELKNNPK